MGIAIFATIAVINIILSIYGGAYITARREYENEEKRLDAQINWSVCIFIWPIAGPIYCAAIAGKKIGHALGYIVQSIMQLAINAGERAREKYLREQEEKARLASKMKRYQQELKEAGKENKSFLQLHGRK